MENYEFYLVIIYTFYLYYIFYPYYYSPIHYITYLLCIFKRFYSKIPESRRGLVEDWVQSSNSKYSKQYKKEYELTQEQKESIIGIMLADGNFFYKKNG